MSQVPLHTVLSLYWVLPQEELVCNKMTLEKNL